MRALIMSEHSAGTLFWWRLGFRLTVVVTWLLVVGVVWFSPRTWPKAVPMAAFWWFRAIAILGVVHLLYEVNQVSEKRLSVGDVVLDALLVLPMFCFWFIAWAASY